MAKGASANTNIEIESDLGYKSTNNCDTFRDTFSLKVYVEDVDGKVSTKEVLFLDLNNPFLEMNKHFLLARCEIKEFQPRWQRRPQYLSYDEYGTTAFGYLLQFVNDCVSMVDFDFEYVRVPKKSAIKELIVNNITLYPDRNRVKEIRFM